MKTVFIACRLLWKRKLANLALILQVLFSVITLAQLFVFVADHVDSVRAVGELPYENAVAMAVYYYCDPEQTRRQVLSSPQVAAVGEVYLGGLSFNGVSCNLAVYDEAIIERYTPSIEQGEWLSSAPGGSARAEAVVSGELGLQVGDTATILLPSNKNREIVVTGVLKTPAQYFHPNGAASPAYFSAEMVVSRDPAILLRAADLDELTGFGAPVSLFVFLQPGTAEADAGALLDEWSRYGEATPMESLFETYYRNAEVMIGLGAITFLVFLAAAATGVLGNNVIQSMRNRRLFTVYYLLGMDWKRGVLAEVIRVGVLLAVTMALCVLAGRYGLLMLEWMSPLRAVLFYGIVLLYLLVMFAAVGAGFLLRLMRTDISTSLKELHQGE